MGSCSANSDSRDSGVGLSSCRAEGCVLTAISDLTRVINFSVCSAFPHCYCGVVTSMGNQKLEAKISVISIWEILGSGTPSCSGTRDSICHQKARMQMYSLYRAVILSVMVGEPSPWEPAQAKNHVGKDPRTQSGIQDGDFLPHKPNL